MKISIQPCDLKTVNLKKIRSGAKSLTVTFPLDIITRYNLKDKDEIIICYLCKANEDIQTIPD